jgi:hypothetical protein
MRYSSKRLPLPLHDNGVAFARADLRFVDIEHNGDSFEGRIFFNRPQANLGTPTRTADGYAGSLYVFGHPHCWGDPGHCSVPSGPLHGFDDRPPHHLVPQLHVVDVTEAIRALVDRKAKTVAVTVLPIVRSKARRRIDDRQLRFSRLELVTYD